MCFVLVFLSCSGSGNDKYLISGKLYTDGFDGKYVFLAKMSDETYDIVDFDSTRIVGDTFQFEGIVPDSLEFYHVFINKFDGDRMRHDPIVLVPERDTIHITLNDKFETTVSGAPFTDRINELERVIKAHRENEYQRYISPDFDGTLPQELIDKAMEIEEEISAILEQTKGSPSFDDLLNRYARSLSQQRYEELAQYRGKRSIIRSENAYKATRQEGSAVIGEPFFELHCQDVNGNDVALSQFVEEGKIVFLDFWASWCGPCRQEIPLLKEVYSLYKDKGLEVISIAVHDSEANWLQAVQEEDMPWPQLLSTVEKTLATQVYGFNGIPYTLLIGKDGKVIGKNLRGVVIKGELQEIFE